MFRCYSYTIIRGRINLCLLKLQLLKYFDILLTVHLSIIPVINKLYAQNLVS